MLKMAIAVTNSDTINKLIYEGNYKFLNFSTYKEYNLVELQESEWNKISKVSVNENGDILGYFSASISQSQARIDSCFFVKFPKNYRLENDKDTAYKDFREFVDHIMNHPIYKKVIFQVIKDNPSNKVYEEFLHKYNGERFLLKDYVRLEDGKYYDTYLYYFNRKE